MNQKKEKEHQEFEAFLKAHPSLEDSICSWKVQEEEGVFPDVICKTRGGEELGFELGEWVNQEQISQNRKTEKFISGFMQALGNQPENETNHIRLVLLSPKNDGLRFNSNDSTKLRKELHELIQETDQQWPSNPHWQSSQGHKCQELNHFPTLGKYLTEVWFVPKVSGRNPLGLGISWIRFKSKGGSYSEEAARVALCDIITKKLSHYGPSENRQVSLLIHFGENALFYNTPFMGVDTLDFEEIARKASEVVLAYSLENDIPFKNVFLCNTLSSELVAYKIFPRLTQCD